MAAEYYENSYNNIPGYTVNDYRAGAEAPGVVQPFAPQDRSNPIDDAAAIQARKLKQAKRMFKPYREAGIEGLQNFQDGSTVQGLDEILAQIFGSDTFGALNEERTRAVQGGLAAGGLTRSGAGVEEMAAVPTDIAMFLEQLLSGRNADLAGFGFQSSANMADLTTRVGEAIASGYLGNEQMKVQRENSRNDLKGSIITGIGAAIGLG